MQGTQTKADTSLIYGHFSSHGRDLLQKKYAIIRILRSYLQYFIFFFFHIHSDLASTRLAILYLYTRKPHALTVNQSYDMIKHQSITVSMYDPTKQVKQTNVFTTITLHYG